MNIKIINQYKGKVLAVENFGSNRKKFAEDFSEQDSLLYELQQLNSHELSLTDEGVQFLDDFYGLEAIAELILERRKNGISYKYDNKKDIVEWIKSKGNM